MILPMFICHGSPDLMLQNNEYTRFLRKTGDKLRPKAIVIFTAHFEEEITTICFRDNAYDMIYDFYGFPKELYSIKYQAIGSKEVALKLKKLLDEVGIKSAFNKTRGIDHGTWSVLKLMFDKAPVPVIQVSINPYLRPEEQYEIGKAIRSLADEDILVIGSGATVHNLSEIEWDKNDPEPWAVEFDDWLIDKVEKKDLKALYSYRKLAPYAKRAVPREEHLAPLFVAMGSGSEKSKPKALFRIYEYGTLSYIFFQF